MARLTVNEAGTSGYTDELVLTPSDFTAAAGNSTTVVNFPVKTGDLIDACALVIVEAFSTNVNMTVGPDGTADGAGADPNGFITNVATNAASTNVNTGALLDDGGEAQNNIFKTDADGNITITASGALDGDTAGKMRVLFSVKRTNF